MLIKTFVQTLSKNLKVKAILSKSFPLLIALSCAGVIQASPNKDSAKSSTNPEKPSAFNKVASNMVSSFANRKEVQQFIQQMSKKHGFDIATLTDFFKAFSSEQKVITLMDKPSEAQPWYRYQKNLVTEQRIKEGVLFWKKNATILKKAEKQFGVPPEIIVAILGIETYYGQRTGTYPVLQSLATLAFDYPRRADFFKSELEQFLLLVKEEKLDPIKTLGSYSGAIGAPQFMPSSYRRFAVDFENKGKRDLMYSMSDTIASVANYFKIHGWLAGEKIVDKATVSGTQYRTLLAGKSKDPKPSQTLNELAKYNIRLGKNSPSRNTSKKVKFIALEKENNQIDPWLLYNNFYVITRYNHSTNYAMAVYQLSQQIRSQMKVK
jgi:membrane-bound lytic murein transglycosylase B